MARAARRLFAIAAFTAAAPGAAIVLPKEAPVDEDAQQGAVIQHEVDPFFERGEGAAVMEDDGSLDTSMTVVLKAIGDIPIVTVETRAGSTFEIMGTKSKEGKPLEASNPGAGAKWKYYRTKNGLMLKWLRQQALIRGNESIAVLTDASDMLYGGCSESDLMGAYRKTVAASGGAHVVLSAEVGCYPAHMARDLDGPKNIQFFESRRVAVNAALGLPEDWVEDWHHCTDRHAGPCDAWTRYRHLNYGFMIGPIGYLTKLLSYVYHDGARGELDQGRAMEYMLKHREQITLDYAGAMVLSMHNLKVDKDSPVEIREEHGRKTLWNKITRKTLCFAHGNGNAEGYIDRVQAILNPVYKPPQ